MKFLHTADIHAKKSRAKDVVKLIDIMLQDVEEKKIDAVLFAGDFWDCAVVNNASFAEINAKMTQLIQTVPVYMIYGTPSHEVAGSLEVFKQLGANVADTPTVWSVCDTRAMTPNDDKVDVIAIPEPRKSLLLGNTAEETSENVSKYLNDALKLKHDKRHIIMWHGEVSGAKYQNGKDASSDSRLNGTMVKDAMAVLCGHIHLPQEVGKFNYCGSPIPLNFGELHRPAYNIVTIDEDKVSIEKRYLPFSQNRVVDCTAATFKALYTMNFQGLNVKVNLSLPAEARKLFKVVDETKKLKEQTNADSIKIAVKSEDVAIVRSEEIVKTTSNTEKLKIWAKLNEIDLTQSIIDKSEKIQDDLLIKYNFPSHSFELMSLSLRGAKGIRGKEEINIDFSKYDDGILAVIGPNGSGKSTLIEFASPYPCLLTRGGALRSHFYLKDSHRIIVYKDENGKLYKLSTFLAAHVETGLVKYYAETSDDNGESWKSVKDCDGNLEPYKTYIEETFGSLSVYLRTAFFTRGKVKGVSDIASATKGERIELLSQLFGTDSLSTMHDMVKEQIKAITQKIELHSNCEEEVLNLKEQIERQTNNAKRIQLDLEEVESNLKEIDEQIVDTKQKEEDYNKQFAKSGNLAQAKADAENRFIELQSHLEKLKEHKKQNDYYKLNKDKILEYKKAYEDSRPMANEIVKLSKDLSEQTNLMLSLTDECNEKKELYEAEHRKLSSADDRIRRAKEDTFDVSDVCPTCGAKLSEKRKKELRKALETANEEVEELIKWKAQQDKITKQSKEEYNKCKEKLKKATEKRVALQAEYDDKNGMYAATQAYLDLNEEYAEYADYTEVSNLESDIERISKDLKNTQEFLDSVSGISFVDFKSQLEELETKRKDKEDNRLKLSVDLATTQSTIKQAEETLVLAEQKAAELQSLSKDLTEYTILERAYANSGIQALELEAAIPEVAMLTNSILQFSYGDKFQVAFSTLRQGKEKIVDDFCIDVTNTESGYTTPIELLSAGEKIWVIQSLYFAFSIIRMQRTGFAFKVRFVDESDGELDNEKRLEYVNMIRATHEISGARLTCMVTHSQELKDTISQHIEM